MILAVAMMLFQMQALPLKAGAAIAVQQDAAAYAKNIPGPALFSALSANLPDNDGKKKTPMPVLPDANTQILSGVYVPDHFEPLPPLPNKHYGVLKSGADKRLSEGIAQSSAATFYRALRHLKIGLRPIESTRAANAKRVSVNPNGQILLTSQ